MLTPPDPYPYNRLVWEIVRQIPMAIVATYGQIASMIPAPPGIDPDDYDRLGARWVGEAMNAVSSLEGTDIPWHRVINAKGGISMADTNPAAAVQRGRLRYEGVLGDDEPIDLRAFGWTGPDAEWLEERGLKAPRPIKPAAKSPPKPAAKTDKPTGKASARRAAEGETPRDDDDTPTQLALF